MLAICRRTLHFNTQDNYQRRAHPLTLIVKNIMKSNYSENQKLRVFSFPDNISKKKEITEKFQSQFSKEKPDERILWKWIQWQTPSPKLTFVKEPITYQVTTLDQFKRELNSILKLSPFLKIYHLERYIFHEKGVGQFDLQQTIYLCQTLINLHAHELFVELFEKTPFETLRNNPLWVLPYCEANLKSCYVNPNKILSIFKSMPKKGRNLQFYKIKGLTHIYKSHLAKETVLMLKTRQIEVETLDRFIHCFNLNEKTFSESLVHKFYKKELSYSINAFEIGIKLSFDVTCGLYLIYQLFEARQFEKAYRIGRFYYDFFLENGSSINSLSHLEARAVLIFALIADATLTDLSLLKDQLIATCKEKTQRLEALEGFKLLQQDVAHPYIEIIMNELNQEL